MSTIWDMIPYQHLSHDSWPLGFLTPHLVPINIYLCSLVIFDRIFTAKVTESCSLMLGLTMRTAMLGLDLSPPLADGLLQTPYSTPKTGKETIVNLYLPQWMPKTVGQTMTLLQFIFLGCPATISLSDLPGTFPLVPYI
jgi:hypothetical protein